MRDWLVLLAIGVGTYLLRASFLVANSTEAPPGVERALPYIGPAVLGAMVAPALILPAGAISVAAAVPGLLAAAVCGLAWWRSRSIPLALVAGLMTAWTAEAIVYA